MGAIEKIATLLAIAGVVAGAALGYNDYMRWREDVFRTAEKLKRDQLSTRLFAEHLCRFIRDQNHYADTDHLLCNIEED